MAPQSGQEADGRGSVNSAASFCSSENLPDFQRIATLSVEDLLLDALKCHHTLLELDKSSHLHPI